MLIGDNWKIEVEGLDFVIYTKVVADSEQSKRMKANWESGKFGRVKKEVDEDDGEKELMGVGRNKGWKRFGYYSTLRNAGIALVNQELLDSDMVEFNAIISRIDKLDRDIITAINSNKENCLTVVR